MGRMNPSRAECRAFRRKILAAFGVSGRELHRVVIHEGFLASGLDRAEFDQLQVAFHAVQGLQWAAEEPPARRAFWVQDAVKRANQLDIPLS